MVSAVLFTGELKQYCGHDNLICVAVIKLKSALDSYTVFSLKKTTAFHKQ